RAAVGLSARHALGVAGRGTGRGDGVGSAPLRERAGSELFGISHRAFSALPKSAKNQLEVSAFTSVLRAIGVRAVMDTGGGIKNPAAHGCRITLAQYPSLI